MAKPVKFSTLSPRAQALLADAKRTKAARVRFSSGGRSKKGSGGKRGGAGGGS